MTSQRFRHNLLIVSGVLILGVYLGIFSVRRLAEGFGPCEGKACIAVVMQRINVGDDYETVIRKLPEAWYHTACGSPNHELFFFGPKSRRGVEIVQIGFKSVGESRVVDRIGTSEWEFYFESDWGQRLYGPCMPPELSSSTK